VSGGHSHQYLEEKGQFEGFSQEDRQWICFVLSSVKSFPEMNLGWKDHFGMITLMTVSNLNARVSVAGDNHPVLKELSLAAMIEAGLYSLESKKCIEFYPFRFLLLRLFGVEHGDKIMSAYLACITHPHLAYNDEQRAKTLSKINLAMFDEITDYEFLPDLNP
jgi:hypothetical protein